MEEERLATPNADYNLSFYPNVCHVCKRMASITIQLTTCVCHMIRYCSHEHMLQHEPQHKEICQIFQKLILQKKVDRYAVYNRKEWISMIYSQLSLVKNSLNRTIMSYEVDMILFTRSCIYCHVRSDELIDCSFCPLPSFCYQHKKAFSQIHKNQCVNFYLCYILDSFRSLYLKNNILELDYLPEVTDNVEFEDSKAFLTMYVNSNIKILPELLSKYIIHSHSTFCIHSEYITRPLTLFYVLKRLGKLCCRTLMVHIIANDLPNIATSHGWEILLHLMPTLLNLKIITLHKETYKNLRVQHQICENCTFRSKKVVNHYFKMSYLEYMRDKRFVKPDIIVKFTAGIYSLQSIPNISEYNKTLEPGNVRAIAQQNCPFILASLTELHAQQERHLIETVLNNPTKLIVKNPYASLRPYRDFLHGNICFDNDILTIYEDFESSR